MILTAACAAEQAEQLRFRVETDAGGYEAGAEGESDGAEEDDSACGGAWFPEVHDMAWLDLPTASDFESLAPVSLASDWSAQGALPTLRISNLSSRDRAYELELRVQGTGNPQSFTIGTETIDAESHVDIAVQLPTGIMTDIAGSEYSAQLVVLIRPEGKDTDGGRLSPPLYLHYEGAKFHAYDEAGLVDRHKAGDLEGTHYDALDSDEQDSLVRIARGVAVVGDPGDPSEP